jgi:hypothetical protein
MNSLVTKKNVINEIDSILRLTSQIGENLVVRTSQEINEGLNNQYDEITLLSGELRKIDLVLNDTVQSNKIAKMRNQRLIYKLSY